MKEGIEDVKMNRLEGVMKQMCDEVNVWWKECAMKWMCDEWMCDEANMRWKECVMNEWIDFKIWCTEIVN